MAKPVALITGASSGLGSIYADRLARRGWDLLLAARNHERLATLATRLERETGSAVEPAVVDLSDLNGRRQLAQRLSEDSRIEMLVNNAGFGSTAPLKESDPEIMEQMIELNVSAVTMLANAAARAFAQRGRGAIINMASITAVAPTILNGVYGATKAYVLALSQSLHHELAPFDVKVQVVLPGATATEFWDASGSSVRALPASIVMRPEDVVDAALSGFDQGEFVTIPSLPDASEWEAFDAARTALLPNLSRSEPAERYRRG
ncbi:SDR family oxidoreductase [Sphingomonas daechungensis]|nr:SDR family oxidoreductase [Sphingomonas daechungensis]